MRKIQVGSINGGNNQFNQNNVSIKNVHYNSSTNARQDKGNTGQSEDGFAILFAILGVVIITSYLYLKYYEPIFFWLKVGVLITAALHACSFIAHWRDDDTTLNSMLHTLFGLMLAAAQAYIIMLAINALPPDVFAIANRPATSNGIITQAMEVWNRFNGLGHRLITENMTTAILLTTAIVLNFAYAMQHLLESIASSEQSDACDFVASYLHMFKAWGNPFGAFLTLISYLVVSGVLFPHTF